MTTIQIIAFAVGLLGMGANFMIFQQTTARRMRIWKLIGDTVWLVQNLLLGAYTGAIVFGIAILRGYIFLQQDKRRWARSRVWPVVFIGIAVASALLTWKNVWNVLPLIASVTSVLSFWIGRPKLSLTLCFPISMLMLIYDAYMHNWTGIVNECMSMTSALLNILRARRKAVQTAK